MNWTVVWIGSPQKLQTEIDTKMLYLSFHHNLILNNFFDLYSIRVSKFTLKILQQKYGLDLG